MSQIVKTLKKKGDASVNVYPNIITDNIPASAVTTAKIADGAVTNTKLSSLSVDTSNIVDEAVTTAKIADGAVTSDKLSLSSINGSYLEDASINIEKLNTNILQYTHQIVIDLQYTLTTFSESRFIITFLNVDLGTEQTASTLISYYPFTLQGYYVESGVTYIVVCGYINSTNIRITTLNTSTGLTSYVDVPYSAFDDDSDRVYTIYGYPNV